MCGRSRVRLSVAAAKRVARARTFKNKRAYRPMNNAFPGCSLPILTQSSDGKTRELRSAKWGLIPSSTFGEGVS